jgi:glycosyltransferase involved in cell wall biosynthesis
MASVYQKKITICICTYNNYALLYGCLQRLANQSIEFNEYDVLIMDNSPSEYTEKSLNCRKLCKKYKNFMYIHKNTDGLSGARNACVELVTTELIHFIDDDTLVDYDFVNNTLECFSMYTNLSVMGGKVIPNWSLTKRPNWITEKLLGYLSMLDFGDKELWYGERHGMWFVGANICFRTKSILKYGGFSNNLGRKAWSRSLLGSEEMELIYKMTQNEEIIYNPKCIVNHIVQPDRMNQSWFIKRVAWQSVSDVMTGSFYLEEPGEWSDHKFGYDFIQDNINLLFTETDDGVTFEKKLRVVQILSFWVLNDFKIK